MILFIAALIFALLSLYTFYKKKIAAVYIFLFAATLSIRLYYNAQDPYLHNWDERYHALVAKNMMTDPFTPMLRKEAVLPYNYQEWCCNHIWVHKQPLFLWQIALSMKIFGVNEFGLRFPSALLCALLTAIIFRMGLMIKKETAGLVAALLFSFSFFSIEQTSGVIGMDHNDVAMGFYVMLSLWCLLEYFHSGKKYWIFCIGLFAGMAILVKWLIGLLVYACWGLCILLHDGYKNYKKEFLRMAISLFITCVIFIPWQVYILLQFPMEAKTEYAFNRRHITETLENHTGGADYYLTLFQEHYSAFAIPLILAGLFLLFRSGITAKYKITISASVLILYIFFSCIVLTKSPGYVYITAPFVFLLMGLCYHEALDLLKRLMRYRYAFLCIVLFFITNCYIGLQYEKLRRSHEKGISNYNTENLSMKVHNSEIYKQLDTMLRGQYLVFNCNGMEETEAMFYSTQNVYSWYPEEKQYDSLKAAGYMIAAFRDHGTQLLPGYMKNDPDIVIIDAVLY